MLDSLIRTPSIPLYSAARAQSEAPAAELQTAPPRGESAPLPPNAKLMQATLQSAKQLYAALQSQQRDAAAGRPPAGETQDRKALALHQLDGNLRGLSAAGYRLAPEAASAMAAENDAALDAAPQLLREQAPTLADHQMYPDSVLWDNIAKAIGGINDNYLGVYENVVGKYTAFYQAFSDILAKLGSLISSNDKGDKVTLEVGQLVTLLEKLKTDFSLPNSAAILFPKQGAKATEAQAKQWASELGLPDGCVKPLPGGGYGVVLDLGPITVMTTELNKLGSGKVELDNAKFQSWKAGFDAQEEKLKNTLQTLTQKYSNANSLFDNLVKVLSSTISSCLETAKSFLQI
ncbi:type III secretion system needle tip protein SctA [Chromobacterium subtsugae]|uniref:Translocator protein BipD n=1 Tax=Chromobacterium subtsugae TaxID=251747 RepID=A0ABS7FF15_9NEIS|nr:MULTISPECIES: type III secretion system needle tip protein SctA [Chromobacterium]KUM05620.1 hypothetical protein Cv017_08125 [Chromobacterium subtsugae]KZE88102.1 hypothetical protein AWB61_07110 [Chromobacterium sp. F49]MBW7565729.1 type III secretion system needle tip protein SctA [Chromobacterium subtsugae]MBW8288566.1 type III secretion system needle tip protein SctA [Chromobacterium subtsugae]WSE89825.1 type III secretion system needle tip protein SctA [Chromobacterium subtsugae]